MLARLLPWLVLQLMVGSLPSSAPAESIPAFEGIRPILEKHCLACHDSRSHQSGLVLESPQAALQGGALNGPAVIPGKSRESPLILYLTGRKQPRMPLSGNPLSDEEIALIAGWIDQLRPLSEAGNQVRGWPLWGLKAPEIPQVRHDQWVKNPIDAFILAKLESRKLAPASPASKRLLLRRLYFDLIGLPPTPEAMQRFNRDPNPDAYRQEIDQLLRDPRYGERWGRHWLDIVRYADTDGGYDGPLPHIWRYRDYVVRAFNQDRPFDRFIREQIAGDSYPLYGKEGKLGLGFLHGTVFSEDGVRRDALNDIVNTTASAFLGLTLACARCHDHKYDPIPIRDYYRMEAFFAPVKLSTMEVPFSQYELAGRDPKAWEEGKAYWEGLLKRQKEFREKTTARFKERLEKARFLQAFQDLKELPPLSNSPVNGDLKRAALEGVLLNEQEQALYHLMRKQTTAYRNPHSPDYFKAMAHSASASLGLNYAATGRDAGGLPDPPTTFVLEGGDPKKRGKVVQPGFLSALTGHSGPARLEEVGHDGVSRPIRNPTKVLAEWIASPENPLTARVMVNRIWQHHFGRGLVRTPNDFGRNGSGTDYPELIDWLATRFIQSGWSVKSMHRLILQSNTYRQSIHHPEFDRFQKIDPENRYYWRWNMLRLEAEAIRDSVLAVSGQLNPLMGGPGFFPRINKELLEGAVTWFEPSPPEERNRRSLYMYQQRSLVLPLVKVFDGTQLDESCAAREVTTVTPQVFVLFNSQFAHEQSRRLAGRIIAEVGDDPGQQLEQAFQLALQRSPTPSERTDGLEFLGAARPVSGDLKDTVSLTTGGGGSIGGDRENPAARQKKDAEGTLTDLCLALFNLNEFIYIE